ncbi:MAG: hypothetical protein ACOC80_10335 [Petrotogales bacterium]
MKEVIERGPLRWYIYHRGIRGGVVRCLIYKNRLNFIKQFTFATDEDYNIAMKILREKAARILYMKAEGHPQIYRLANYAIDATEVEEVTEKEFNYFFENLC